MYSGFISHLLQITLFIMATVRTTSVPQCTRSRALGGVSLVNSFYRSVNGKWNGSKNEIINGYGYYCAVTNDIPHVWHRLVANLEMNSYN